MHFKILTLAALASAVSAQNLTSVLGSLPQLSQLGQYLQLYPTVAESLATASNVTLLAPNNDAFGKFLASPEGQAFQQQADNTALIEGFFSYHVLDGIHRAASFNSTPQFIPTALNRTTNLTLLEPGAAVEIVASNDTVKILSGVLTESNVVSANHNFTGGVIHIIDTFLMLPQNISATLIPLNLTAAAGALETAEIAKGPLPNNLTAFIPNNAAFEAIGSILTDLSIDDLKGILAYHLVPNVTAYSTDITANMSLPTLANETLNVTVESNGEIFVNSAKVLIPNILVQEGVVHVIDQVLNPNSTSATNSSSSSNSTTSASGTRSAGVSQTSASANFPGASSGSVPYTSDIPSPSTVPSAATATTGLGSAAAPSATSAAGSGASASGSGNAAAGIVRPVATGAVGLAAAAAVVVMAL